MRWEGDGLSTDCGKIEGSVIDNFDLALNRLLRNHEERCDVA
jgi:hypothetical protein